jgi:HSP20 family protein
MAEKTVPTPQRQGEVAPAAKEGTRAEERFYTPPVDIISTADGLVVAVDLPGVPKDRVSVQVKNDVLTIEGRSSHPLSGHPVYREFELANYFREFQLSDAVDTERITADLKNGVLLLRLPKPERAKPKQIAVKVE